jgi:hypothetical protein
MNRLAVALLGACLLALPARAETLRSFDAVLEALNAPLSRGDTAAASVILAQALRDARVGGWLTADWALFYAMQADFTRLERGNPAYALQLTEDGLAMIASDPGQADFAAALRISQAYALADLGRFGEAAATARLALPAFRRQFGDADADDLAAHADGWAEGRLSAYNSSAADLARAALDRAYEAAATGNHGRAIAIAAGAILPPGSDLPEAQLRGIGFEAEKLIADSLAALGRIADSVAASRRALDHLTRTPWQPGTAIDWWPEDWEDDDRAVVFDALSELAPRAMQAGQRDLGAAALREAGRIASNRDQRLLLLLLQRRHAGGAGPDRADRRRRKRPGRPAAGGDDRVLRRHRARPPRRVRRRRYRPRPGDRGGARGSEVGRSRGRHRPDAGAVGRGTGAGRNPRTRHRAGLGPRGAGRAPRDAGRAQRQRLCRGSGKAGTARHHRDLPARRPWRRRRARPGARRRLPGQPRVRRLRGGGGAAMSAIGRRRPSGRRSPRPPPFRPCPALPRQVIAEQI